jgi:class 3 adenylate cyclase/tetratricopeptide (TPR) repeat protein
MTCQNCGAEVSSGQRFCTGCGRLLEQLCPACGITNPPGSVFCGDCGNRLDAGGSPPVLEALDEIEPERRHLTVMFCDLVGSTALSTELDPEELRELIARYQETCAEVIARFDGFIARYMGDGILVYFGYPQAHEHDAERAAQAGLGIIESIERLNAAQGREKGVRLAVRVGVATGLVVAGDLVGKGAAQEKAVVGETPNLAARLQNLAEPGKVVIADSTHHLLGGLFECQDLGNQELKGFPEPVRAWRVIRPANAGTRFEAARAVGVTPLVGREEENDLLLRRWSKAREGEGQVVLLSGEAGIGKSRLIQVLRERIVDDQYTSIRCQCSPYHRNSALYPVITHIERAAGFKAEDTADEKLDRLVEQLDLSAESACEVMPLFAALLSIPAEGRYPPLDQDPQYQKDRTLTALCEQVEALAKRLTVLFVFEDAQWIDPTSLEFLDLLVEQAPGLKLMVLITFRPEFAPTWTGQAHVSLLALNRMSRRHCSAMVEAVSGGKTMPGEVIERIVDRTDGVPLFVEELTQTVLESDLLVETMDGYVPAGQLPILAIPETLQDSLMARLDRLGPAKEVCQIAATIGREFSYELLAAVSSFKVDDLQNKLSELIGSGLVFRRGTPPRATYTFKHGLIQETAYESLLMSRRQQLHANIARALEDNFPAAIEKEPELVAHHLTEASMPEPAVEYWRQAGERAVERWANAEAIGHFTKAVETLRTLPTTTERVSQEVRFCTALAASMRVIDHYEEAFRVLDRAEALAADHGLALELSRIHYLRGNLYFPLGNFKSCLKEHEQARQFAQEAASPEEEAKALSGLSDAYYMCGRMITAHGYVDQCLALCRDKGFQRIEVANRALRAFTGMYLNDLNGALDDGLAAAKMAAEFGDHRAGIVARNATINILWDMGELDRAREHCDQSLDLSRRVGARRFEVVPLLYQGKIKAAEGHRSEARRLMEEALAVSRETGLTFRGPSVLGGLALVTDDPEARKEILAEGDGILLRERCVSHNYFAFYRDGMEALLEIEDWEGVERYASALEDFASDEPLPWTEFFVTRGRALANHGRGKRDAETLGLLKELAKEARRVGFETARKRLNEALADFD